MIMIIIIIITIVITITNTMICVFKCFDEVWKSDP